MGSVRQSSSVPNRCKHFSSEWVLRKMFCHSADQCYLPSKLALGYGFGLYRGQDFCKAATITVCSDMRLSTQLVPSSALPAMHNRRQFKMFLLSLVLMQSL
uniref:Uncharacterized protein n=1 Tax=Physcomitrium patens TaxID=3218 RepID=A0A2K1KHA4_PHYPA|nr:hypothetical protein PHYPA_009520 [Physcomitrium patens]